jgi:hypothetical protein
VLSGGAKGCSRTGPISPQLRCSAGLALVPPQHKRRLLGNAVDTHAPPLRPAGVAALSDAEVRQLMRQEIDAASAGRVQWEHIRAFEVLKEPFRWEQVSPNNRWVAEVGRRWCWVEYRRAGGRALFAKRGAAMHPGCSAGPSAVWGHEQRRADGEGQRACQRGTGLAHGGHKGAGRFGGSTLRSVCSSRGGVLAMPPSTWHRDTGPCPFPPLYPQYCRWQPCASCGPRRSGPPATPVLG